MRDKFANMGDRRYVWQSGEYILKILRLLKNSVVSQLMNRYGFKLHQINMHDRIVIWALERLSQYIAKRILLTCRRRWKPHTTIMKQAIFIRPSPIQRPPRILTTPLQISGTNS